MGILSRNRGGLVTFKTFIVRHKNKIISAVCGLVAGAVAALALLGAVLFGYYGIQPQDAVGVTIAPTEIQGTKEDGSKISGFIITTDDGTQYLVTDYWTPIMLSDENPEEN